MDEYFKRAIPEPFRILGLALKPLSLGRYRLLSRFGCSFVAESEGKAGVADLLLGCVICSMQVDEFLQSLDAGTLAREIRRWSRSVCPMPWLGRLPWIGKHWRATHHFDAVEKILLFQRYLEEGSKMPLYWDSGEGKASGAHWSHAMETVLRGELGWTRDEINEEPLTKAMADYFKYAESQGMITLMTPDEIAQVEASEADARKKASIFPQSAISNLKSEMKPEVSRGP